MPRDLYVPIDGQQGRDRINSAIQGGPERLINTIKSDFGIPINHYIEMNFFAFRSIVVGRRRRAGVLLDTGARPAVGPRRARQPAASRSTPSRRSRYARSRDFEYFENGRWKTDPTGDLGRISRQQAFIRKVIQRAIDKGARNPAVLNDLHRHGHQRAASRSDADAG